MNCLSFKMWSDAASVSVALQGPGMGVVCSPAGMMPSGHEKER